MANPEHLKILKQGVEVWNRWREENPEVWPNLFDARLLGEELPGVDLNHANLIQVQLAHANLAGAIGAYLVVSYLGAVAGIVVSCKRYDWRTTLLLLLLGGYFVVLTGAAGLSRFRLPVIPFYLGFTGVGVSYLYERARPGGGGQQQR